jgi:formate dehydrogenase iron-sulfur subunit
MPQPGVHALIVVAGIGTVLIGYRFFAGLGAVTNLSDGYPWGFWIAIDILVGIALASGGFLMAGIVHLFGGRHFHSLARPAILSALLGYLLFIGALMVDLGRPWHIWKALFSWNHQSPMFEVAWCVMFYTVVLTLEFAPAIWEKFGWQRIHAAWKSATPFVVMALLTMFAFAMTGSVLWAGTTFLVLGLWETLMRGGVMPRDQQMPLLLILAGVVLSTLHQSSLGSLFLIVDRMNPLWYSPVLPHLFFLSAVMVAPAVVALEVVISSKAFGRKPERMLLMRLGGALPFFVGAFLILRLGDLAMRQQLSGTLDLSLQSIWWWLEAWTLGVAIVLGIRSQQSDKYLPLAAVATIAGLVVHRTGVAIVGITAPGWDPYVPAIPEMLITAGIVSIGLLVYRLAVKHLPIYEPVTEGAVEPEYVFVDGAVAVAHA